jgi:lysyl-tRNA synthetase class I
MPTSDLSSKTFTPIPPPCPTCGKEMKLMGIVPNTEGTIYEYLCENGGDRLTWQPRHWKSSLVA